MARVLSQLLLTRVLWQCILLFVYFGVRTVAVALFVCLGCYTVMDRDAVDFYK